MITQEEVLRTLRAKNIKPSEQELRRLPYKEAFIYPRLSSPGQVKESRESMHEIAELLMLAKQDGFHSNLTPAEVEAMLAAIQQDITSKGVLTDGEITIDFRDLGLSGTRSSNDRPSLKNLIDSIEAGRTGTVYMTEVSRLTRDQRRITPYTLLELFKLNGIRVRTPEGVRNPQIQKDYDDLRDDLEAGIEELKIMARRLNRKRLLKAARGEYVGGPVPAGFVVEVKETEPSGHRIYGKYKRYPPHAEINEQVLKALIKNGFSKIKTHRTLGGLMYPLFPPDLMYMERLTALRKATKVEGVGYLISPSMIGSLANIPELIGIWTWGDLDPKPGNHECCVPIELWLEVHEGFQKSVKPRGRGARHEPLEWNGILWDYNHEEPRRISGHGFRGCYRCESDYVQGRGPACLNIAAHLVENPLTEAVLRQLDFTPFAEEVLMQLEADGSRLNLEDEQRKKEITSLSNRINRLKSYLGDEDKKREDFYWEQIEVTQSRLDELNSRTVPVHRVEPADFKKVRDFLAGIGVNWGSYSRTFRNRILNLIIDRVEIRHKGQDVTATIRWKTGQTQVVNSRRPRALNPESSWKHQEKDLLKMLWPSSSRDAIIAAFPGRTWSAIAHQAHAHNWKRIPAVYRPAPRRGWSADDDCRGRELYSSGMRVSDIAGALQRSVTAVAQQASRKRWRRINVAAAAYQSPDVSNGITSGFQLGGWNDKWAGAYFNS